MSKIDELIAQYCPNGVEFKELREVCEIKTGQQVSKIEIQQNPDAARTQAPGERDLYDALPDSGQ